MAQLSTRIATVNRMTAGFRALNPFAAASYGVSILVVVVAGWALDFDPLITALLGALLCGWAEVDGLCGMSHVGTLTPLRLSTARRGLWVKAVGAYTAGGLVTAAFVGALFGTVGHFVDLRRVGFAFLIATLATLLIARELQLVRYQLPQIARQTYKFWAMEYGILPASAMWGAHIGLGLATVVQHGGLFVVLLLAFALGPAEATFLVVAFWAGRTLPLWFAGMLNAKQCDGPIITDLMLQNRRAYCHVASLGIATVAGAALMLLR
jgi:hypothetical protein